MIAAPQKILVESNNGSPTDSLAVTKEALPPLEEGLFGDLGELDQPFQPDGSWLHDSLPPVNDPQANQQPGIGSVEANDSSMFAPLAGPAEADELPRRPRAASSPGRNKPSSTRSKQILLVGAIGLCSLLVACGAFVLFLTWISGSNRTQDKADPPAVAQVAPKLLDSNPEPSGSGIDPSIGVAIPEPALVDPIVPATGDPPSLSAPASASDPSNPTAATPTASGQGPRPEGHAPIAPQPEVQSTSDTPPSIGQSLPPGLQNFANLFDQSIVPLLPDSNVALSAAPAGGTDSASTDSTNATAAMSIDLPDGIDKKKATIFSGLILKGRPLSEALTALSLITDIPFTVDLDAVSASGIDPNIAVNFKSTGPVSVSGLLEKIAQELSLSFDSFENKFLVVRGTEQALTARIAAPISVVDLVSDEVQGKALGLAIAEILPELSGNIQYLGGELHTDLEKTNRLLWHHVARLVETWRAKRTEEPSPTPKAGILPDWPLEPVKALAQTKITKTYLPEPLAISWQRAASEAGLICWVDWPGLLNLQIQPGKVAMAFTHGRTLEDLLHSQAEKYSMVFAIEDGRTLWATSPEMHRFQSRLYVLPIAGKSIEEWTAELKPLTPYNFDGTPVLKVVATPDKRFIFVRCCRPLL